MQSLYIPKKVEDGPVCQRVTVLGHVCVCVCVCVCMCVCVCLSVKSHLASVRPENTVAYSAGNGGQIFVGFSLKLLRSKVMA